MTGPVEWTVRIEWREVHAVRVAARTREEAITIAERPGWTDAPVVEDGYRTVSARRTKPGDDRYLQGDVGVPVNITDICALADALAPPMAPTAAPATSTARRSQMYELRHDTDPAGMPGGGGTISRHRTVDAACASYQRTSRRRIPESDRRNGAWLAAVIIDTATGERIDPRWTIRLAEEG